MESTLRPLENLSHRQRELTPPAFAEYLVERVREMTGNAFVAALFVRRDAHYRNLTGVDCWDVDRDAMLYPGLLPIVAHPPCGPWGHYSHVCWRQNMEAGRRAMAMVHRYGGVVEQPLGSSLFRIYGREGAVIEKVNQSDFGHVALKPTLLYFYAH